MLNWLSGLAVTTVSAVKPADDSIEISAADATRLNRMAAGDHVYLTLRVCGQTSSEEVKYTHTPRSPNCNNVTIPVTRNISGEGRKAFPKGTVATAEPSVTQLSELIRSIVKENT